MNEEVKTLISKCKNDLATSEYNYEGEKFDASLLYAQKSVKKALKAYGIKKIDDYPKIHDLQKFEKTLNLPDRILKLYALVNLGYLLYEHHEKKDFSKQECKEIIKTSQEILLWVEKNIN